MPHIFFMKKLVAASVIVCSGIISSQATVLFSDTFDTYTAGNLVGQGPWTITGTSVVNPIQATGSAASLTTTGQDAFAALPGGVYTIADGTSFYIGLTLDVTSAQAAGDYFLHTQPAVNPSGSTFVDLARRSGLLVPVIISAISKRLADLVQS